MWSVRNFWPFQPLRSKTLPLVSLFIPKILGQHHFAIPKPTQQQQTRAMAFDNLIASAKENPLVLLIALLVPALLLAVQSAVPASKKPLVNLSVQKENPKASPCIIVLGYVYACKLNHVLCCAGGDKDQRQQPRERPWLQGRQDRALPLLEVQEGACVHSVALCLLIAL